MKNYKISKKHVLEIMMHLKKAAKLILDANEEIERDLKEDNEKKEESS